MTDQEWQQLEEKDAVLRELESQYKKPRYDPFEIFKPTKGFIKEVIKQLNKHPYATTRTIYQIEKEFGFLPKQVAEARSRILGRIKQYKYFLTGGTRSNSIGESEIQRAKSVPLREIYVGSLKRTGRTLVGKCPFHEERTGSFTIYTDRNTWRCFGCNNFGDSIDFIISRDQTNFVDAVKLLIS